MSVNLGRVAYVEKGAYDGGTTYQKKDVVFYNNGSFVFIADAPAAGIVPTDTAYWQPMLDPTYMNQAVATANQAAETANQAANAATTAANAANTAAEAADEARLAIAEELNKKAPAIFVDASGEMVHITDGAEGMPVKSLVTAISAADGANSVSVIRTGKNLVPGGTLAFTARKTISFSPPLPPGTYTLTAMVESEDTDGILNSAYFNSDTEGRFQFRRGVRESVTVTYNKPIKNMLFCAGLTGAASTGDACTWTDVLLTSGDASTEFEPYEGQTLTAELPETVTEGSYDWVSGVLTKADGSTVRLTPQQLSTLKGTNHIWSNAGTTTVTYAADTKLYADAQDTTSMIGKAEPGMVATQNYSSGDFIVVGKSLYRATEAIANGEAIVPGSNCQQTTVAENLGGGVSKQEGKWELVETFTVGADAQQISMTAEPDGTPYNFSALKVWTMAPQGLTSDARSMLMFAGKNADRNGIYVFNTYTHVTYVQHNVITWEQAKGHWLAKIYSIYNASAAPNGSVTGNDQITFPTITNQYPVADTPAIKGLLMVGSGAVIPAGLQIKIWGVRA